MMKTENLQSVFVKRYFLAVSIIALLAAGAFYILSLVVKESESTALVVNISGKQRMLAHRVAFLSEQYYLYRTDDQHYHLHQRVRDNLLAVMKEMSSANIALSSGVLNGKKTELSYEIKELYFGDSNLKQRVEQYLHKAHLLLDAKDNLQRHEIVDELIEDADTLYIDLNRAVELYQKEGEEKVEKIQKFEFLAFALTIVTLLLEIIFIFQPMTAKFRELCRDLEYNRANLEQEVQARTLKLEKMNLKLMHLASHDPLTGLKNRLNMERELEDILAHYQYNRIPYAVLLLDIDWFKKINDTYGHDIGDYVLRELANILSSSVRDYDSVFRAGGEEFVIIFNRISEEKALDKSEKIRHAIEQHHFGLNGLTLSVTVSGGLYYPSIIQTDSVKGVIKLADIALYKAKTSGRNKIVVADEEKDLTLYAQADGATCALEAP